MINSNLKDRRLQFTSYGKILLSLSFILFGYAYLFINLVPAISATSIILYLVYVKLDLRNTIKNINFDIDRTILEEIIFANKPFNIVLTFKNNSGIAYFEIEDQIPTECSFYRGSNKYSLLIDSDEEVKIKYSIYANERGNYAFNGVKIKTMHKNRLFQYTIDKTVTSNIKIHSNIDSIKKAKAMAKREKIRLTVKAKNEVTRIKGHEFDSIRSYLPGDSLKDIEWKTTSKLSKLMTKVFEEESAIPSIILLDCSKSMRKTTGNKSKIDHGIQLSLQLIKIFQAWEHPIGFIAFDEYKVLFNVKPSTNRMQLDRIFNKLPYIPDRILVKKYETNLVEEPLSSKSEHGEHFIGMVGPFLTKQKREYTSITQATGIYEAIRTIVSTIERNLFLLLISDLETNPSSLYEAFKLIKKYRHKIVIITPFTHWYDSHPDKITPNLLEATYKSYLQKQKIIKKFRGLNVEVIEITPQYEGRKIIQELERYPR